jgi:PAS domain S-box-containing protein
MSVFVGSDALRNVRPSLTRLVELIAVAVIYFVTARGSLTFASINPSATPVWPPAGLALGLLVLMGRRALPAIFIGSLAANLATAGGVAAAVAIALGNAAEAFIGASLINRWAGGVGAFQNPLGVARIAASMAVGVTVSATVGTLALGLSGTAAWHAAPAIWMTWWLGDLAGAAMVAPVIVLWAMDPRPVSAIGLSETLALAGVTIVVGLWALGPLVPAGVGRNGWAFAALIPLMWAALRGGSRNTATVALALSAFAVWGVTAGTGPFLQPTLNASFLLVVSFIVGTTLPSLALGAAVASRDKEIAKHELAVQAGKIGIWDWDLVTNEIVYSPCAKAIFGFPLDQKVTFEQVRDATHPEDLPNTSATARRARDPGLREEAPYEYRIIRPDGAVRWVLANGRAIFRGDRPVRYLGTLEDITDRKLLAENLAATNAKLRLAMLSGRLGVWELKAVDGTIVGSPELNELLGFPRDRVVTSAEYRSRYAEGEYDRVRALALAVIERGESTFEAEARFVRTDGSALWLLIRAEFLGSLHDPARDSLGVVVDITDRKQTEEHLMLLMRELNHRVKNALAVVQSISAQTYRTSPDPREAHARFEGRLQALARAHDVLTGRQWRDATVRDVVMATIVPHADQSGSRLRMSGPPAVLDPQHALALSMVFHELATNAIKYGAWSNEGGWIELEWAVDRSAPLRAVDIRWSEHAGPSVAAPHHRGFGLKMIERSLAGLDGTVELTFAPDGFRCTVRVPVAGSDAPTGEG